jgi:hypothetical protein
MAHVYLLLGREGVAQFCEYALWFKFEAHSINFFFFTRLLRSLNGVYFTSGEESDRGLDFSISHVTNAWIIKSALPYVFMA